MTVATSNMTRIERGLRTVQAVGLAVLMAKAGLAVPAAPPVRLPPFSAVLADIGDEQSLSASLSTFSGHLRRTQARPTPLQRQDALFVQFMIICIDWVNEKRESACSL